MARTRPEAPATRLIGRVVLWFGILAGPVVWALHALGSYFLAPTACRLDTAMSLDLLTAATLLLAVAAGVLSWAKWQRTRVGTRDSAGGPAGSSGFMALAGIYMSGVFALIIVVESVPIFFLGACEIAPRPSPVHLPPATAGAGLWGVTT